MNYPTASRKGINIIEIIQNLIIAASGGELNPQCGIKIVRNISVRLKSSQSVEIAATMPILAYIELLWILFTLVAKPQLSYIKV